MATSLTLTSATYPDLKIIEPVLLELLASEPIQRLKGIHNAGYHLVAGNFRDQTRYEHSIGVMSLLRLFDAPLEEQISGLLHDISHTAFSHVSTYVLQDKYDGTEFHERQKKKFVLETEIPEILERYGYDLEKTLETENYPLLENELPDICADRIDYSLRDGLIWQATSKDKVREILDGLTTRNEGFVFKSKTPALLFSELFFNLNKMLYGSPYNAYFNYTFGELIKYAISKDIITEDDWFKDDHYILSKLRKSRYKRIKEQLAEFDGKVMIFEDRSNFTHTFPKKLRVVDPPVLYREKPTRLSQLDSCYKKKIDDYRKEYPEWKLKISLYPRDF